jgi:hypothetical protein
VNEEGTGIWGYGEMAYGTERTIHRQEDKGGYTSMQEDTRTYG